MAQKDRFTDQEWHQLSIAPLSAFTAIVAANQSGVIALIKEFRALAKAMKSAKKDHNRPPVVNEMISSLEQESKNASPDSPLNDDYEGAYDKAMAALSAAGNVAVALTPEELDGYVSWVLGLGSDTAAAVTEKGTDAPISSGERDVLAEIERRLRKG